METKFCKKCEQHKPLHHFGHQRHTCNVCMYRASKSRRTDPTVKAQRAKDSAKTRERNREIIYDYLASHSCADCGETNMIVLEFDHVHGKTRQISNALHLSVAKLEAEIAKCEIVCRNCHCIRTYQRMEKCNRLIYAERCGAV